MVSKKNISIPTRGNDPSWRAYFSTGLVQPPTSFHETDSSNHPAPSHRRNQNRHHRRVDLGYDLYGALRPIHLGLPKVCPEDDGWCHLGAAVGVFGGWNLFRVWVVYLEKNGFKASLNKLVSEMWMGQGVASWRVFVMYDLYNCITHDLRTKNRSIFQAEFLMGKAISLWWFLEAICSCLTKSQSWYDVLTDLTKSKGGEPLCNWRGRILKNIILTFAPVICSTSFKIYSNTKRLWCNSLHTEKSQQMNLPSWKLTARTWNTTV